MYTSSLHPKTSATRDRSDKLQASLGGIREMGGVPDLLFVIDVKKEALAIHKLARRPGNGIHASAPHEEVRAYAGNDASRSNNRQNPKCIQHTRATTQIESQSKDLGEVRSCP